MLITLHTHPYLDYLFGLGVGMDIGGVRSESLDYPSSHDADSKNHVFLYILLLNCEFQMMSSGSEPKIHLRGLTPHMLIYGGLGHHPLPFEELVFSCS